jgi:hypothetical protein
MASPSHVPIHLADKPRIGDDMPPADSWRATRPAEVITKANQPCGHSFGIQGPDQGFGLKLARRFEDRLVLDERENHDDVVLGCFLVGLKRAALFGRAPVIYDFEHAFTLFGYVGDAPPDLLAFRIPLFESVRHHDWERGEIVDRVPDETLRLTPAQVRERLGEWRTLIRAD